VTHQYTIAGKCPEATLCILIDVYKSEIEKIQEEGHQTMGPESVDEPEHTPATLLARDAFYNLVKYIAGSTTVYVTLDIIFRFSPLYPKVALNLMLIFWEVLKTI
jgi:hypothetical protein